jgi:hypothetical protein
MSVFLSHNSADKAAARALGAQLKLVGADVWFDEWEIRAGDSIVGAVDEALGQFEVFVLVRSEDAASSSWVRSELETAIARRIGDSSLRVIPVLLDDTPLPALLQPLRYVRYDAGLAEAVDQIMGFSGERDRLRAIQAVLDEAGIEVGYFYGYGPAVACPNCGAPISALLGWHQIDHEHDREYAGVECTECGWNDGGEV